MTIKNNLQDLRSYLVLGRVSNESLSVSEGDIAGSGPVTLIIRDDLHLAVLEDSNTGVGGPQVNTHGLLLGHLDWDVIREKRWSVDTDGRCKVEWQR